MNTTFADLGVPSSICEALSRRGIDEPFEIQAATIADALEGRDICGRAPTGSGKTLAFGIPLVATVGRAEAKYPRGLILAPTRELADQIAEELLSFSGKVSVGVVYGGVGYGKQLKQLNRGVDILVACPGRLEDLIERGAVHLDDVDQVVLDEADRMADMGFLPAVRRIIDQTAEGGQTILFSATLEGEVGKLTRQYQTDPVTHLVGDATPDITSAEHRFILLERENRVTTSAKVIKESGQAIVFCRTRHGCDRLAKQLNRQGVEAVAIHGGHAQNRRTRSLSRFTDGDVQALVATDVAARGIHVDDVAAVIHFDPPGDDTTYIHRSGRTARAGREGVVVSLILDDQVRDARKMQRNLGLEVDPTWAPHDAGSSSGSGGGGNNGGGQKSSKNGGRSSNGSGRRRSNRGRGKGHSKGQGQGRGQGSGRASNKSNGNRSKGQRKRTNSGA